MPALGTSSRGVARVNGNDNNAVKLALVLEKTPKLIERPVGVLGALCVAYPFLILAHQLGDTFKVLDADGAVSELCLFNNRLAYYVVDVALVAFLPTGNLFEPAVGRPCVDRFQSRPAPGLPKTVGLDVSTRKGLSITVGCDVHNSQIHPKDIFGRLGFFIGNLAGGQQKPLASRIQKVGLPFLVIEKTLVVIGRPRKLSSGDHRPSKC